MGKKDHVCRVLGIVGSPRRGGNTETMVDEVLAGAAEAGAPTEKVILSKLDVGPCRACDACRKTGKCVQQDGLPALLEQMDQSQVWVLGTPVYYWGPTAQFKAFVDRWYSTEHQVTPKSVEFEGKRVILAIPLGGADHDARHTVGMIEDALAYKGVELFATVVASGVERKGAVRERPNVLAAARQAGRDAVEK
ncbi:MAG: flavodoxin family protein [Anaerolineae bacterium]|nr:flavodoxin family protein [Anaerolineae bacterium]